MCGVGIKLVETDEYSESGRGIYPDGLYRVLLMLHERYKHLKIPFIVTENGVSDETDVIRRPYLIEHLLALYAAMLKVFFCPCNSLNRSYVYSLLAYSIWLRCCEGACRFCRSGTEIFGFRFGFGFEFGFVGF